MGFSANTQIMTVDGMKHIQDLTTDDRVLAPRGPTKVTYCGYYKVNCHAINVGCKVVVVGSHLMQSWKNGWLHLRAPEEDERLASLGYGTVEEPYLGKHLIRDDFICTTVHPNYIKIPLEVAPREMWVFGTESGLSMVGPYVARTNKLPKEGFAILEDSKQIVGPYEFDHHEQEYNESDWIFVDFGSFPGMIPMYDMLRNQPPPPRKGMLRAPERHT